MTTETTSHNPKRFGATVSEWEWAAFTAGQDLLPAVGNPALIADRSERLQHLTSLDKTPSWIGSNGKCYGVARWASHIATPELVDQWKRHPDYNCLLITRNIRAIDIDIDNPEFADYIERLICAALGVQLPVRYRANSGKRTMLVRLDPHTAIQKRVVHTPHGAIEFLADGQQTLLFGTHRTGVRMQHRHFENGTPTVPRTAMAAVWDTLRATYDQNAKPLIILGEQQGAYILRQGGVFDKDPVLKYLHDEGWVQGTESDGKVHVRCPNAAQHTTQSVGSTTYFPAGLGRDTFGFRCLHSHCQHITPPKFLELIGYRERELQETFGKDLAPNPITVAAQHLERENLPQDLAPTTNNTAAVPQGRSLHEDTNRAVALGEQVYQSLHARMDLKPRSVKAVNNLKNLSLLLEQKALVDIRHDAFRDEIYIRLGSGAQFYPLTDNIISSLRVVFESFCGATWGQDEMSRQLSVAAERNQFDSAHDWLALQQWDGRKRVAKFGTDILAAVGSEYITALSEYLFVALAGRILSPGCKADIAPVLLSPKQGTGKSSLIERLTPFHEWFNTVDFTVDDADIYRAIRGKLVVEVPELRGLIGRDAGATKALVSQTVDSWTPKYKERAVSVPRRALFVGSDNRSRFLTDVTGNRRWAPAKVARTKEYIDWPTFEQERDQYYAEAVHMLDQFPTPALAVEHYSTRLRKLAGPALADAQIQDAFYAAASRFIRSQHTGARVSLEALAAGLFSRGLADLDNYKVARLRNIMTAMCLDEAGPDEWIVGAQDVVL